MRNASQAINEDKRPVQLNCAEGEAVSRYLSFHAGDEAWIDGFKQRMARVESGEISPKLRALIFMSGLLINGDRAAAREYADKARSAGATDKEIKLATRILEFYRGLKMFQDAQQIVGFWSDGKYPVVKKSDDVDVQDIFDQLIEQRGYVANGFRVYSADAEWLRLYLQRSLANRDYNETLSFGEVQLLSFAITFKNHGYSGNFNDGCVHVHEKLAKTAGFEDAHVLEVLQILELCDALSTCAQATDLFD